MRGRHADAKTFNALPFEHAVTENLERAVGPLWRGVVQIDNLSFLNDIEKLRLIAGPHAARLSVRSYVLL